MGYSGTQDIIFTLGGTNSRFSVGTTGTHALAGTMIDFFIQKADNLINFRTEGIYGTSHFGTSSSGTRGLPAIIKDISTDLASYYVIRSLPMDLRNQLVDMAKRLKDDVFNVLDSVADGSEAIPGYAVGDSGIPSASDLFVKVYDESVVMTGTELQGLEHDKVIKGSERVHGTSLDGTTVYTKDTDYKIYYFEDALNGGAVGNIRRIGTTIADGQTVLVDYSYYPDHSLIGRPEDIMGQSDAPELEND